MSNDFIHTRKLTAETHCIYCDKGGTLLQSSNSALPIGLDVPRLDWDDYACEDVKDEMKGGHGFRRLSHQILSNRRKTTPDTSTRL